VAGFLAFWAALSFGLLVGFVAHLVLGGKVGWEGFDLPGLLEWFLFLVAFLLGLFVARRAARVPCSALLSGGLVAPPAAKRVARPLPELASPADEHPGRLALLVEEGRPVGVLGLGPEIVPWDEVLVVSGDTALTDLAPLLWRQEVVFVADGDRVHGAITREDYLRIVS